MADEASAKKETYRLNCHCGAFVFEAALPEITEVPKCNCSICYKKAYHLAFTDEKDLKVIRGDVKDLTTYTFANKTTNHMFCPKCGVTVLVGYSPMPDKIALSFRAIQGPIDVWNLPKKLMDGKSIGPAYVPPSYDDMPEPSKKVDGGRLYHGSCHCGGVRAALSIKPLVTAAERATAAADAEGGGSSTGHDPFQKIVECNCSICQRSGATWIYPPGDQVALREAEQGLLRAYPLGFCDKQFCGRCGTFVASPFNFKSDEEFARLPDGPRNYLASRRHMLCLNLRLFQDVDVDALEVDRFDGWNKIQPMYVNP